MKKSRITTEINKIRIRRSKEIAEKQKKIVYELENSPQRYQSILINFGGCNLNCEYCAVKLLRNNFKFNLDDLEKKLQLVSKYFKFKKDQNLVVVVDQFGEVSLHQKEVIQILIKIKKWFRKKVPNVDFFIMTNGTIPFTRDFLNFLKEEKEHVLVQISFDGSPEVHDKFRNKSSSETVNSIKELIKNKIRVRTATTLSESNDREILQSYYYFIDSKIIKGLFEAKIMPVKKFMLTTNHTIYEPDTYVGYNYNIIKTYLRAYLFNRLIFKFKKVKFNIINPYDSICYYNNISIFSNFEYISGCTTSTNPKAYIGKFDLKNNKVIFNESFKRDLIERLEEKKIPEVCKTCEYRDICGSKTCIYIRESEKCHLKIFYPISLVKEVEEKNRTYPFYFETEKEFVLVHSLGTIRFSKVDTNKELVYVNNYKDLIKTISGSRDEKLILFHNTDISKTELKEIKSLLKNKPCGVAFLHHVPLCKGTIESLKLNKIFIPSSYKDNLDAIRYFPKKKIIRIDENGKYKYMSFNTKEDLLIR